MARTIARMMMSLLLLSAGGQGWAQDDVLQRTYASVENGVRAEYEAVLAQMTQSTQGQPPEQIEKTKQLIKMLSYNKAALFASCADEAEQDHAPSSARVPSAENLVLRTCVEIRIGQLNKFSQIVGYVDLFFPDRIAQCGEKVRLRDLEKALPPFAFLFLDEPRLYDFARYNECLMPR
jgi:hypothetical protein